MEGTVQSRKTKEVHESMMKIRELINKLFPGKVTDVAQVKIYFDNGSCLVLGKVGLNRDTIEFYAN